MTLISLPLCAQSPTANDAIRDRENTREFNRVTRLLNKQAWEMAMRRKAKREAAEKKWRDEQRRVEALFKEKGFQQMYKLADQYAAAGGRDIFRSATNESDLSYRRVRMLVNLHTKKANSKMHDRRQLEKHRWVVHVMTKKGECRRYVFQFTKNWRLAYLIRRARDSGHTITKDVTEKMLSGFESNSL